jgi:tRNA(Ile)-lysidine synthase
MNGCKAMADSTTPKPTPANPGLTLAALPATLALAHFKPALPFAVALSGGADSTALLLACVLRWPQQVRAVHVHHGLQAAADGFAVHCEKLCEQLSVPLAVERINAAHAPGESPEEAARRGRYLAMSQALQTHWGGAVRDLALAQHADDQVETMLLALSRGAGLPGLSAMPEKIDRHGMVLHRPWLHTPGADIRQWLRDSGVAWVEDPTNANEQFTRNRIRQRLLPALQDTFPSFRQTFARSARHAAQAQQLLNTLAQQDLHIAGDPPRLQALQVLDEARQVNLLRFWLNSQDVQASAAQIDALLVQIRACTTRGHRIDIKVGNGFVKREGECLHWYNQKL